MEFVIGSQFLLWGVVLIEGVIIFALARQIGVLHERIAPMGALVTDSGPAVGEAAPKFAAVTLEGQVADIGGVRPSGRAQLLIFVSPSCPVCKKVAPIARKVADSEGVDLIFVGDGDVAAHKKMVERLSLQDAPMVVTPEIGLRFHVGKLPYGVLLSADGHLAAKGLVNSREHIESLLIAKETGFASAQDFLRNKKLNVVK